MHLVAFREEEAGKIGVFRRGIKTPLAPAHRKHGPGRKDGAAEPNKRMLSTGSFLHADWTAPLGVDSVKLRI